MKVVEGLLLERRRLAWRRSKESEEVERCRTPIEGVESLHVVSGLVSNTDNGGVKFIFSR